MKKIALLASFSLCFIHMCFAQFTAGQKVLGGRVSVDLNKTKDTAMNGANSNWFSFGISPSLGKFKNDKTLSEFSIGFQLGHYKRTSANDSSSSKSMNIGIGYSNTKLYSIASKVYFTLGYTANLNYGHTTSDDIYNQYDSKTNSYGVSLGITPGILVPVRNNKMLLRTGFSNLGSLNYNYSKDTRTLIDGSRYSTTNTSGGMLFGSGTSFFNGLYVGLSWLLK